MIPTLKDLQAAHNRIRPHIHETPVLTSKFIDDLVGCKVYFKCENFQKVGAFKARGGYNAILSLSDEECKKGVTAHSSGNHAQAVAIASRTRGIDAYIVMPKTAPKVKVDAVKGYGAEVIMCEPTLEARESTVEKIIAEKGANLIHPFDDYRIIAGQSTATLELLDQAPKLDYIMAPIGGGGLISGACLATKYLSPTTKVIGSEPEEADDAYRSLKKGVILPHDKPPKTVADGLLTTLGVKTFNIIKEEVDQIWTVSEAEIIEAMKIVWQRMKIIIEPSCAVPLAALIKNKNKMEGSSIGLILTGGNVDLDKLPF